MAVTLKGNNGTYEGTSEDNKPLDVPVNTEFNELDTGKTYYFDGETWNEEPPCEGGGFVPTSEQLAAMNSGITDEDVTQIETNKNNISFIQQMGGKSPNLINTYDINSIKTLNPSGVWTDNTYTSTDNGSITVNSDGTITVNGNFTVGMTFNLQLLSLENGEYYFSGCPLGGSASATNGYFLAVKFQRSGTQYVVDIGNGNFYTKVDEDTNITLQLWIRPQTNVNNKLWKIYFVSKSAYDAGYSNYQPYALSNAELTSKEQTNETNILSEQAKTTGMSEGGSNYITVGGRRVYVDSNPPTGARTGDLWIGG